MRLCVSPELQIETTLDYLRKRNFLGIYAMWSAFSEQQLS